MMNNTSIINYLVNTLNENRKKFIEALEENNYNGITNIPTNILLLQSFYNKDLESRSNGEVNMFSLEWFRKNVLILKHKEYNGVLMWSEYFNLIHSLHYNDYTENEEGEFIPVEENRIDLQKKNLNIIPDALIIPYNTAKNLVNDSIEFDEEKQEFKIKN